MILEKYFDFFKRKEKVEKLYIYEGNFDVEPYYIKDGKFQVFNHKGVKQIPDIVKGDFYYSGSQYSKLRTLEGSPKEIYGDFDVMHNYFENLKGCPNVISDSLLVSNNRFLTSLEGCPNMVQTIICSTNDLTNLKGCPIKLETLDCSDNKITSLKGAPEEIGVFACDSNKLTSLEGCPKVEIFRGHHNNINDLTIERNFIMSGKYKGNKIDTYWTDLFNYMTEEKIDINEVKGWPKDFFNDNLKKSISKISKFNL